ncbi:unnamed protein product [Echinostoma caproni]|uniref:tRNA N(3)-methylcytidine methyltransferase n=1 Tax=Echinostoma caproni TaxID=27848 RepID=A0A183B1I6_9TREM|nr:unnamed protein product [Echinostoma caproni]
MDNNNETHDPSEVTTNTRPKFGQRYLKDENEVYSQNAWDNVLWTTEQESQANAVIAQNSADILTDDVKGLYDTAAAKYWDHFYAQHQDKFFKDRTWLQTEFPELFNENGRIKLFRLRCRKYDCSYSSLFYECSRKSPDYDPLRCHAFVFDVTATDAILPFPKNSIDVIVMVFVLSAVSPEKFTSVMVNLVSYMKPGGIFLFRDYGRGDMVQLRFKKGKCLGENFYLRSDGTRVYFFKQEELRQLFLGCGLEEVENILDHRLIVNRKKELKMYRVWIQCKYKKPLR